MILVPAWTAKEDHSVQFGLIFGPGAGGFLYGKESEGVFAGEYMIFQKS